MGAAGITGDSEAVPEKEDPENPETEISVRFLN
jgi:hypothetical protein